MGSDDLFKKAKKRDKKDFKRKVKNRGQAKPRILIVCEGEKTEPQYFEGFRPANIVVRGYGYNTDSLVQKAIEVRNQDDLPFDQVWCVFDRDIFTAQNFNNAFHLAKQNGIKIAYSNEAFELWYYLHFHFLDTGITREQYVEKLDPILSDLIGRRYEKKYPNMYRTLLKFQETALKNAEKLLCKYSDHNPEKDKPSTTVHLLVNELNKWNK